MTGQERSEEKSECVSLSPMMEAVPAPPESERVCVFGTGDLGRSLGLRLLQAGYGVVFGSRRPHSRSSLLPHGAQVQNKVDLDLCGDMLNVDMGFYFVENVFQYIFLYLREYMLIYCICV